MYMVKMDMVRHHIATEMVVDIHDDEIRMLIDGESASYSQVTRSLYFRNVTFKCETFEWAPVCVVELDTKEKTAKLTSIDHYINEGYCIASEELMKTFQTLRLRKHATGMQELVPEPTNVERVLDRHAYHPARWLGSATINLNIKFNPLEKAQCLH